MYWNVDISLSKGGIPQASKCKRKASSMRLSISKCIRVKRINRDLVDVLASPIVGLLV